MMTEDNQAIEIIIDRDKCRYSMYDPLGCKKCLQVCGAAVFATRPAQKRNFSIPKEQRVDPTIWVLLTSLGGLLQRMRRLYKSLPLRCHNHQDRRCEPLGLVGSRC